MIEHWNKGLQPPNIHDDRTELKKLEVIQACGYCLMERGEWTGPNSHWLINATSACDGCILRIASAHNGEWLLDALVDIAQRHQGEMVKLETPVPCELHLLCQEEQRCTGVAHWRASGYAECDEHIMQCVEWHPDSRETLVEALADIRERHLKTGASVRILVGDEAGKLGKVYNQAYGRPAPWHVRPDNWPDDCPGIAYKSDELDVML